MSALTLQVVWPWMSGSGDGDAGNLALVLLLSGFVFYGFVYFRYRNTDKRHGHESETEASMHDVRAEDRKVKSMTGLSNAKMRGANHREVRGALSSGGPAALRKLLGD